MARPRTPSKPTLAQLTAENERLRTENEDLRRQLSSGRRPSQRRSPSRIWRTIGLIVCGAFAVALLIAANLLFWAGNTIVKNDRFAQTVEPLIQNQTVQQAVATYTTTQLFNNVDVQTTVAEVLPPRADFLAPTIANSLRGYTQNTLQKTLANPKFQDTWNQILVGAHNRFITTVETSGGDGVIDINELYQQLGRSLEGTKLSFLANRKLPAKVGHVQVVSGPGITVLHRTINHIDTWRWIALGLLVVFSGLAIYLGRRRRRVILGLVIYGTISLFITLVALRIVREAIAGSVQEAYIQAVRETVQIIFHPLVVQTATLMAALAVIGFVTWISGPYAAAVFVRSRIQLLFAGKLHQALFGTRENKFTSWIGRNKRVLEWIVVGLIAVALLVTRLTFARLFMYAGITLVLILLIELLGAPVPRRKQP